MINPTLTLMALAPVPVVILVTVLLRKTLRNTVSKGAGGFCVDLGKSTGEYYGDTGDKSLCPGKT